MPNQTDEHLIFVSVIPIGRSRGPGLFLHRVQTVLVLDFMLSSVQNSDSVLTLFLQARRTTSALPSSSTLSRSSVSNLFVFIETNPKAILLQMVGSFCFEMDSIEA